jgi:hypothetical protein
MANLGKGFRGDQVLSCKSLWGFFGSGVFEFKLHH